MGLSCLLICLVPFIIGVKGDPTPDEANNLCKIYIGNPNATSTQVTDSCNIQCSYYYENHWPLPWDYRKKRSAENENPSEHNLHERSADLQKRSRNRRSEMTRQKRDYDSSSGLYKQNTSLTNLESCGSGSNKGVCYNGQCIVPSPVFTSLCQKDDPTLVGLQQPGTSPCTGICYKQIENSSYPMYQRQVVLPYKTKCGNNMLCDGTQYCLNEARFPKCM